MLRSGNTTGQTATDHEGVGRLQALGLALVTQVTVVLHVGTVELGELLVRCADGTSRRVIQALQDRTTQEVGVDLDVLVGDWWGLVRKALDVTNTKSIPELRLPVVVSSLAAIGILVVTKANVDKRLSTKRGHTREEVLTRLVVVVLVFLAGPVVRVTKGEDRELDVRKVQVS